MVLEKLTSGKRSEVALLLFEYWKERGMPEYDQKWAENYLIDGHKTEIESDEFFSFIEGNTLIGVISLITDVSNVAEIRDMVIKTRQKKSRRNITSIDCCSRRTCRNNIIEWNRCLCNS